MTVAARRSERALRRALVLFTLASTVVVATEFIVIGLLPVLAGELDVSLAEAGAFAGAFAFAAAVIGPAVTLAVSAWDARRVMAWSLTIFAVGNVLAVVAPRYGILLAVRVLQGAVLPVFISVGAAALLALAPPHRRGRALALANTGFVLGTVLAVPAGVLLAHDGAWWQAFLALALLAVLAGGLLLARFPAVAGAPPPSIREQAHLLRQPRFVSHVVLSVASFASMFAAYTYLAAWLEEGAQLSRHGVAAALAWFGAAGVIGNLVAAKVADRSPLLGTVVTVTAAALAVFVLARVPATGPVLAALLGVWGAMHTAAVTLCQVRVTLAGGAAPAFAMSMNISSANLGIALGAGLGGIVLDAWGIRAIGWGAIALLGVVAASASWTRRLDRRGAAGL